MLVPSDALNVHSASVWKKFQQNPYVSGKRTRKSPNGVAIVGNDSLNIEAMKQRHTEADSRLGEKLFDVMCAAKDWMRVAIGRNSMWE